METCKRTNGTYERSQFKNSTGEERRRGRGGKERTYKDKRGKMKEKVRKGDTVRDKKEKEKIKRERWWREKRKSDGCMR